MPNLTLLYYSAGRGNLKPRMSLLPSKGSQGERRNSYSRILERERLGFIVLRDGDVMLFPILYYYTENTEIQVVLDLQRLTMLRYISG